MITFLTSVRHPLNAFSYKRVETLLRETLLSVLAQKDPRFNIVVVCNRAPKEKGSDARLHFLEVDFPPPSTDRGPSTGMDAIRVDRGLKYLRGLLYTRENLPQTDHIMFFDADDYLSENISTIVNQRPECNGWVISEGYVYRRGSKWLTTTDEFHLHNGSCNILRLDLIDIPWTQISAQDHHETLRSKVDPDYLKFILGSHRFTKAHFDKHGKPLQSFPEKGAVWVQAHGENHSGAVWKQKGERLTSEIRQKFHFPPRSFWAGLAGWFQNGF